MPDARTASSLALCAIVAAGVMASASVTPAHAEFESPLDFFRNMGRKPAERSVEPQRQEAPRRGFFERFFEPEPRRVERPAQPARQVARTDQDFQRIVCRRICDGRELALGIVPKSRDHAEARAMCQAAGNGLQAELVVDDFKPGAGFTAIQTASAPPLLEGRAAADPHAIQASAQTCAAPQTAKPFMVPLLHDATLKYGDIVATADGFKTFVGRGSPPFDESDFVDQDDKRLPAEVRRLQVAAN
ncbi:hypothetical protein [Terrihabitans sp. B22-R8]|uniref:hypothetical protein n=1 Tax=Terrihabitans sp. B22-R8 TaxID=3425128 RepID=UPI00403C53FA